MREWSPSRLIAWGNTIGTETKKQVESLLRVT